MKYKIIEDSSPYYIRFTHDNIDNFVDLARNSLFQYSTFVPWLHWNISKHNQETANIIAQNTPVFNDLNLQKKRISYFISGPGLYYRAHKDGYPGDRYSINYPIIVNDEKCVTSWYSDEDLKNYKIDNLPTKNSRECLGFTKSKHMAVKSMVARTGECILFNTEIFHDWDNSKSSNRRVVLTFRDVNPSNVYFEDARRALFGY